MMHPHKTFGIDDGREYVDRPGAYILPVKEKRVAVVRTKLGLFFLGGGNDPGEDDESTVMRECLEEIGCRATVEKFVCSADAFTRHWGDVPYHPVQNYYLGQISDPVQPPVETDHSLEWWDFEELRGNMFSPMQNWALEMCFEAASE